MVPQLAGLPQYVRLRPTGVGSSAAKWENTLARFSTNVLAGDLLRLAAAVTLTHSYCCTGAIHLRLCCGRLLLAGGPALCHWQHGGRQAAPGERERVRGGAGRRLGRASWAVCARAWHKPRFDLPELANLLQAAQAEMEAGLGTVDAFVSKPAAPTAPKQGQFYTGV